MAKLGPDAQKRAEMLLIDTYRESRDLDHAIAETQEGSGGCAKGSEPDGHAGDAVRRKIRRRCGDEAAAMALLQGNDSDQEIYLNLAQVQERGKKYAEAEQSAQKAEQMAHGE